MPLTPWLAVPSLAGMLRRRPVLFAVLVAALAFSAAFPAAGGSSPAATAQGLANSVTFQDSIGEGGGNPAFPDVSTLVVSNDDTGLITMRINIPNRPALTRDMALVIFVDSDNNPATGDPSADSLFPGTDYIIQLFLGEVFLFKWDGTDFTRRPGDPPATSLVYEYASSAATIKITAAELGNTKRFGFGVLVWSGLVIDETTGDIDFTTAEADVAPTPFSGFYVYDVKIAPARLLVKSFSTKPAQPKAGKAFSVLLSATRSDTNAVLSGGEVLCVAKVGGKTIRAKVHRFVGKQATCTWTVPKSASGQSIRGSIAIVFEGKKATKSFSKKIS